MKKTPAPNVLYPGLPDYTGEIKGWYTVLHHSEKIIEWSENVMERIDYIVKEKSHNEVETRLRQIVYLDPMQFPYDEIHGTFIQRNIRKLTRYLQDNVANCQWDGKTPHNE